MSKASHKRGYPIRRPKERERDLLREMIDQQKREEEREIETIRKGIAWRDTAFLHSNTTDGT